jgi:predicted dehydrogenase/threonine dehydrogenase-like Zn-dependent dehydrogenase
MQQVLQQVDSGKTLVRELPAPRCGSAEVLIANHASLVSAGTEKMVVELARKSLLGKARERPDQVRRVLQKLRDDGVLDTVRQVRAKLADPVALGYSSAGVVLEVGREVRHLRTGDRVASNGPHAGVVAVSQNLVTRIPHDLPFEEACYGVIGAIALQGVRLAQVGVGDRVAVIGLGLIGQIAVRLLRAAGCTVIGTDLDEWKCRLASEAGAEAGSRDLFISTVLERTGRHGADAVLIAASTASNEPLELAAIAARKKARIVAVGAVGLNVPRREFYPKELELIVSCSYGPGRYDTEYEERGRDYPYPYVRWTEQRNIEAVLEQIAEKRIDVARLTTHTFDINEAERAYQLIESNAEPYLGIVLTYPQTEESAAGRRVVLQTAQSGRTLKKNRVGIGFVGAGNFASLVLLPLISQTTGVRPRAICSAGGVSATVRGERHGFEIACTSVDDVISDDTVDAVFLATRHNLHSEQALSALRAGKHVFIEKPLAISEEQLAAFESGLADIEGGAPVWTVGFNRRFSPAAMLVREFFSAINAPATLAYRFNAGAIPQDHWTQDLAVGGGRLVGEACHALDLASFLLGGQIRRVFAESIAPGGGRGAADDQTVIVARFDNGSVASIGYFAGGDKGLAKERIELFGSGRAAVIDDFKAVTLSKDGRARSHKISRRDKGHSAEIEAFFSAVRRGGPPPIPYSSLLNVSWASLAVMESLRTGFPVDVQTR